MRLILALLLFATPAWAGLNFDGTDDNASCGSAASLDDVFAGGGTICLRFKRDVNNAFDVLASKINDVSFAGWSFALGDSGGDGTREDLYFYQSANTGADGYEGFSTPDISSATPEYFVCLQYNATNYTTAPTYAIDGTTGTMSWAGTGASADSDAAQTFRMASQVDSFFDGQIREMYVWTSALSTAQMGQITINPVRGSARAIDSANLVAYWALDDQEAGTAANADVANDIAGNGNDCTADDGANNTGMTWTAENVKSYP